MQIYLCDSERTRCRTRAQSSTSIYQSLPALVRKKKGKYFRRNSSSMLGTKMPPACRKRNVFFYADFNLRQPLHLAERLRRQPCTCNESQNPKSGALNWATFLKFDDGVEWVFRAPCSSYAAAQSVTGRLLASEAVTLKYIREHTSIPVPDVFHYSCLLLSSRPFLVS